MMKIKIRLAKEKDAKSLLKMYLSEPSLNGGDGSTYILNNILDYIRSERNKFFICEYDGELAGALNSEFFSDYVYLQTIVVKEKFRNIGVASALMNALENEMKKGEQNFIEGFTGNKNNVMQKLFEKRGYGRGNTFYYYYKNLK